MSLEPVEGWLSHVESASETKQMVTIVLAHSKLSGQCSDRLNMVAMVTTYLYNTVLGMELYCPQILLIQFLEGKGTRTRHIPGEGVIRG